MTADDVALRHSLQPSASRPARAPLIVAFAWLLALGVVLAGQWFRAHMEHEAQGLSFPIHPDEYRQGPAKLQYAAILGTWVARNAFEVDRASFSAGLSGFALRTALGAVVLAGLVSVALYSARVRRMLHDYFATPGSALDLAAFRIVFFSVVFLNVSDAALKASQLSPDLMVKLMDPLPLWRLIRPSPTAVTVGITLLRVGCVAAVIGWYPRLAAAVVSLALFYCFGVAQLFGKVNHYHHLLWTSAVLAAAPLADALSLHRLLRREPGGLLAVPPQSVAYSRPLRMVWLLMGTIYFYPGFWKVITGGSAWIFSDNLANRMFGKWGEQLGFVPLFRADHYPSLLALGAFATLVCELGWVFFVLSPKTRWLSVVMGLAFHNFTRLLMRIPFWTLQLMYTSFIPWQRLADRFSPRSAPRTMPRGSAAVAEHSTRLTTWTGGIILGFAVLYGTAHLDTAWPFACYPTFDAYLGDSVHDLGAYYVAPDGNERPIPEDKLMASLGKSRLRSLRRSIVFDRNLERRQKSLEAFAAGAVTTGDEAVAIRFYDEARSLVPEERARGSLSRQLLHTLKLGQPRSAQP